MVENLITLMLQNLLFFTLFLHRFQHREFYRSKNSLINYILYHTKMRKHLRQNAISLFCRQRIFGKRFKMPFKLWKIFAKMPFKACYTDTFTKMNTCEKCINKKKKHECTGDQGEKYEWCTICWKLYYLLKSEQHSSKIAFDSAVQAFTRQTVVNLE